MNDVIKIGIGNNQRIQFDKLEKDFSFIVNGNVHIKRALLLFIF